MTICCLLLVNQYHLRAQFIEMSKNAGINHVCVDPTQLSGGVAFLDFQNDGFEDIYVIGGQLPDKLFENLGDGTFRDVSEALGIGVIDHTQTMGVSCGDLDNDGFTDLLITTINNDRCYLFWNNKGVFFNEGAVDAGISNTFYGSSMAFSDYDIDGDLDIYIGNYNSGIPGDYLLKNNGDRTFTDTSDLLGESGEGTALAIAFSDIDMDHDLDILVGNDFGYLYQPNRLFVNNYPENNFSEVSHAASWDIKINSMGIAVGDYDEDGDLDYYVSDIDDNYLFENQNDNTFLELAHEKGIDNSEGTSWGNAFFDYNNDTYLDLYVANGVFEINSITEENQLFKGNGSTFENVSQLQDVASALRGRGVAIGDYDNDGQLDILVGVVTNQTTSSSHTLLYHNPGNDDNWMKIKLNGTSNNKDGYGSLVRIVSEGRSLIRELSGGTSYLSHSSNTIHFGLGDLSKIDSLMVTWPGGKVQMYKEIDVNHTYLVSEDEEIFRATSVSKKILPNEEVFLEGEFRNEEGIYTDTLGISNGMREIVKTRLTIENVDASITSVTDKIDDDFYLKVWPNPFDGDVSISFGQNAQVGIQEADFTIFDAVGHIVFEENKKLDPENAIKLDHLGLSKGLYMIKISCNGKTYNRKVIKK